MHYQYYFTFTVADILDIPQNAEIGQHALSSGRLLHASFCIQYWRNMAEAALDKRLDHACRPVALSAHDRFRPRWFMAGKGDVEMVTECYCCLFD